MDKSVVLRIDGDVKRYSQFQLPNGAIIQIGQELTFKKPGHHFKGYDCIVDRISGYPPFSQTDEEHVKIRLEFRDDVGCAVFSEFEVEDLMF